jgi:hypothetical protein
MTRKAKQLAMRLYNETQSRFPEITFARIQPHPEQVNRFWIMVIGEMDEEREREMDVFVADRATDILIDEGYSFSVMLRSSLEMV